MVRKLGKIRNRGYIAPDDIVSLTTHFSVSFPEELSDGGGRLWEAWQRPGMGFKWSPYQAVQGINVADEVIGGDRLNPNMCSDGTACD
jgi:hypothetical protein